MYEKFYVHEIAAEDLSKIYFLKNAKRIEALREKCPNTGNTGQKKLRISTLFTQWSLYGVYNRLCMAFVNPFMHSNVKWPNILYF